MTLASSDSERWNGLVMLLSDEDAVVPKMGDGIKPAAMADDGDDDDDDGER